MYAVNDSNEEVTGELETGFFRTGVPGSSHIGEVRFHTNASTISHRVGKLRWNTPQEPDGLHGGNLNRGHYP